LKKVIIRDNITVINGVFHPSKVPLGEALQ